LKTFNFVVRRAARPPFLRQSENPKSKILYNSAKKGLLFGLLCAIIIGAFVFRQKRWGLMPRNRWSFAAVRNIKAGIPLARFASWDDNPGL